MEIRGLGVIDIEALFGTLATLDERQIDLVVELDRVGRATPIVSASTRRRYTLLDVAAAAGPHPRHGRAARSPCSSRPRRATSCCAGAAATAPREFTARVDRAPPRAAPRRRVDERRRSALVVVTGLSGSGKSTAIHVLEDLGFYCIDNLPVALHAALRRAVAELARGRQPRGARHRRPRAAASCDDFPRVFDELRAAGIALEVLYLEASDDVLVRRFSETRRPHPAAEGGAVADGIRREREALRDAARARRPHRRHERASPCTSCAAALRELLATPDAGTMTISLVSFGYKYGLPTDADLALDCRFLPNPFFVEELRPKTGTRSGRSRRTCWSAPTRRSSSTHVLALLAFTLPRYQREGKSYLTIAIGCTGGRHRSVVLVEELRRRLAALGHRVLVRHRDIER